MLGWGKNRKRLGLSLLVMGRASLVQCKFAGNENLAFFMMSGICLHFSNKPLIGILHWNCVCLLSAACLLSSKKPLRGFLHWNCLMQRCLEWKIRNFSDISCLFTSHWAQFYWVCQVTKRIPSCYHYFHYYCLVNVPGFGGVRLWIWPLANEKFSLFHVITKWGN